MSNDRIMLFSQAVLGYLAGQIPMNADMDPLGMAYFAKGAYGRPDVYRQGFIVTYNPHTHSAAVKMSGYPNLWTCVFADEMLSYSYGYSETNPPREGEFVLALRINEYADAGIIIGRIPYPLRFKGKGDLYNDPDQYHRRLFTQLDDTWDRNIPCFMEPLLNKNDDSTQISTHFRPTDVYPGEFARVNQHNCGIKGGMFSATLLGGGASLRVSALSNTARLTCEHYLRHSMHGSVHEFHNGRYLSSERNYALYQEERLGGDAPGADVWESDGDDPASAPAGGEFQTMRPRMKDLTGYFGNLSARFCFRPDPDEGSASRVMGVGSPKEAGVSRETTDPSGQYRLSAAGMIAIERTGRIPVPVRNSFPTDKNHDISSDPEKLKAFEHKDGDPAYRQLELYDRQAYDLKNQYARVDGLGTKYPDYDVPQEEDLKPLKDPYDDKFTSSETVKLEKFDKRRAGVYIGEDGSVIIRDAWGSEVVMLGGNITLSCAGNVMLLPGKTQLTIAGDDIVQKAQNSVDIHASEHDVRLSAARNMEMLGGADENSHQGGVIIESRGDGAGPWDGNDGGESTRVSGITLKSENQAIVVAADKLNLRSKTETRMVSGNEDVDGSVYVGAKMIKSRAESIYMASNGSGITVSKEKIEAVGKTIGMYSGKNMSFSKGSEMPVLQWTKTGKDMASELIPNLEDNTKDMSDEETASGEFNKKALDKMTFSFRTSEECGTDKSWTIGAEGPFRMYEPAWVQVLDVFETLKDIQKETYKEDAMWENGKPWPGEDARSNAKYAQLSDFKPANLTDEGFNKSRGSVEKKSEVVDMPLDGNYYIRKQQ